MSWTFPLHSECLRWAEKWGERRSAELIWSSRASLKHGLKMKETKNRSPTALLSLIAWFEICINTSFVFVSVSRSRRLKSSLRHEKNSHSQWFSIFFSSSQFYFLSFHWNSTFSTVAVESQVITTQYRSVSTSISPFWRASPSVRCPLGFITSMKIIASASRQKKNGKEKNKNEMKLKKVFIFNVENYSQVLHYSTFSLAWFSRSIRVDSQVLNFQRVISGQAL